jgi:transcriptional regulator with XRE-family HTH domain
MKSYNKYYDVINNEIDDINYEQKEIRLRAKIALQFVMLREGKNLTQEDIANKLGVSKQLIARFENFKHSPTLSFLVKYAYALDTKLDVILTRAEIKDN